MGETSGEPVGVGHGSAGALPSIREPSLVVNHFLAGMGKALSADALDPWRLETVWDDKVLHRAFEVFGGAPPIELVDANDTVPQATLSALAQATRLTT